MKKRRWGWIGHTISTTKYNILYKHFSSKKRCITNCKPEAISSEITVQAPPENLWNTQQLHRFEACSNKLFHKQKRCNMVRCCRSTFFRVNRIMRRVWAMFQRSNDAPANSAHRRAIKSAVDCARNYNGKTSRLEEIDRCFPMGSSVRRASFHSIAFFIAIV